MPTLSAHLRASTANCTGTGIAASIEVDIVLSEMHAENWILVDEKEKVWATFLAPADIKIGPPPKWLIQPVPVPPNAMPEIPPAPPTDLPSVKKKTDCGCSN